MNSEPFLKSKSNVRIVTSKHPPWAHHSVDQTTLWCAGDVVFAKHLAKLVVVATNPVETFIGLLRSHSSPVAGIIETPTFIVAFVDHCRSFPVFYTTGADLFIGNNPRDVKDGASLSTPDPDSIREAAMAGYVTGPNTLLAELKQLEPGSFIFAPLDGETYSIHHFFEYVPKTFHQDSASDLSIQLSNIIDSITDRAIEQAADAPVWVPLSGGLDSRLVLAKLKARGCNNLHAFSYGPKGNADAMIAQSISEALNVPWRFVHMSRSEIRTLFVDQVRKKYWPLADGLSSTPNHQDVMPLIKLQKLGILPDDAIIMNGQTGDFISGGHIPQSFFNFPQTVDSVLNAIVTRHYSLWRSLMTPGNIAAVTQRIRDALSLNAPNNEKLDSKTAIALWEQFEYQGRQAQYIINGQRSYDFLGLRWTLPLWDRSLVNFWRDVPPELKRDRRLYRDTWTQWDYRGVFSTQTRPVTAWSRPVSVALIPLSIGARLIFGRTRRDRWISYARYFDRFGQHYQIFGWRYFFQNSRDARSAISFYTRAWLDENDIQWPGSPITK